MEIILQCTIPIISVLLFWTWTTESRLSKMEKSLKYLCREFAKCQQRLENNIQ